MTWNAGSRSPHHSGMESCRRRCMSRRTVSRRHTVDAVSTYPARCNGHEIRRLAMCIRSDLSAGVVRGGEPPDQPTP
jgi:hypothetical protein